MKFSIFNFRTRPQVLIHRTILLAVFGCPIIGPALADGEQSASSVPVQSANEQSVDETPKPAIGMSMAEVRDLLGQRINRDDLIGGSCGMLEVLTTSNDEMRVIGVGGVVTSVTEKDPSKD